MISCQKFDQSLGRYLNGELSDREAEAVEAHAGDCDRCAEILDSATRVVVDLPSELSPPPTIRQDTLAAIAIRPRGRRRAVRWLVPPAIAAALMMIWGTTQVRTKAAMMRARESESPHALANSRAFDEFEQIARAREEILAEGAGATDSEKPRLSRLLERLDEQYDALVAMVQEYES